MCTPGSSATPPTASPRTQVQDSGLVCAPELSPALVFEYRVGAAECHESDELAFREFLLSERLRLLDAVFAERFGACDS
eukprot:393669-Alexandrium_andersonii.AAC.1